MTSRAAPFDRIARDYHRLWDAADVGRLQREAAWRYLGPLFHRGDRVLDLGCGAGDDALRFSLRGVEVMGIDASTEMVRVARERGVDAVLCDIGNIASLHATFDGAVSNFGALNCIADLGAIREPLSRSIVPGGCVAICLMSRFCLWETVWYLLRGELRKAARRWKGSAASSLGFTVFYPTRNEIVHALSPAFIPVRTAGIGILVPPSFVQGLSGKLLQALDRMDRRIAEWPVFACLADHQILVFRRV